MSILLYSLGDIAAATSVEVGVLAYRFFNGSKLLAGLGAIAGADSTSGETAPC